MFLFVFTSIAKVTHLNLMFTILEKILLCKAPLIISGPVRDIWLGSTASPDNTRYPALSTPATCINTSGNQSLQWIKKNKVSQSVIQKDLGNKENISFFNLLKKFALKYHYSSTTGLIITLSAGCILLVLNIMIFIGIYYRRNFDKKRVITMSTN